VLRHTKVKGKTFHLSYDTKKSVSEDGGMGGKGNNYQKKLRKKTKREEREREREKSNVIFVKLKDTCGTYRLTKLFFATRARSVPSNDNDLLADAINGKI